MTTEQFFTVTETLCDWDKLGDDEAVLAPLIDFLSQQPDEEIFSFEDIMSELLHTLDTRKNFQAACKYYDHSDDTFLYARCVALVNGAAFYERVRLGKEKKSVWTSEFECILSVPETAWAKKHHKDCGDYPHLSPVSYETGSNTEGWK